MGVLPIAECCSKHYCKKHGNKQCSSTFTVDMLYKTMLFNEPHLSVVSLQEHFSILEYEIGSSLSYGTLLGFGKACWIGAT